MNTWELHKPVFVFFFLMGWFQLLLMRSSGIKYWIDLLFWNYLVTGEIENVFLLDILCTECCLSNWSNLFLKVALLPGFPLKSTWKFWRCFFAEKIQIKGFYFEINATLVYLVLDLSKFRYCSKTYTKIYIFEKELQMFQLLEFAF